MVNMETIKLLSYIELLQHRLRVGVVAFSDLNTENYSNYSQHLIYNDEKWEFVDNDFLRFPVVMDRVVNLNEDDVVSIADDACGYPVWLCCFDDNNKTVEIKVGGEYIVISPYTWRVF